MGILMNTLKRKVLILDGAMGTNLLDKGRSPGEPPCALNLNNPHAVYDLQKAYVDAGSDIILTNTFGADPLHFKAEILEKIIAQGVKIAQRAARKKAMIFGDVTTLGELIKPYGELEFAKAMEHFCTIFKLFRKSGVKIFLIETFTSMIEAKAAFFAARNFSDQIYVSFSLEDSGRTLMGETPESIAVTFEALGAKGLGVNCTLPDIAAVAIEKMSRITSLPLMVKPNAGHVEVTDGKVKHAISEKEMASYFKKFVQAGATIIGGCCGTTPGYIKRIAHSKAKPKLRKITKEFILASPNKLLKVENNSTVVVGERLNPSGRKKIKEGLIHKDFKVYGEEARLQEQTGADILDVNAFSIDVNEKEALLHALYEVIKNTSLPLCIDTQNYEAAEAVLSFYPGIGIYNSIPVRKKELQKWLPMIKKYGFKAVISLVGKKMPKNCEERMANAQLALKIARKIDFPEEDLIFDPLVFSASTEQEQLDHTLDTVAALHKKGIKTIMGISNISFGLPDRPHLNAVLTVTAMKNGVTFLIVNTLSEEVMNAIRSSQLLFKDGFLSKGVSRLPTKEKTEQEKPEYMVKQDTLADSLIYGDKAKSVELAQELLNAGTLPQVILDHYITSNLKVAGEYYEKGKFYVPDLLMAAEAARAVLSMVIKFLPKGQKKGKVILATVKGDIHDIGKNIVAAVFESAGYEVIDLGKDVPDKKIIKAVKEHAPEALGLSALLTTTMPEMGNVIAQLNKENLSVKVIIGGPNVSDDFAKKIGAYGAARNVFEGLRLLTG